jgi:hypothetical protein
MARTFHIVGDILKAFSVEVEIPDTATKEEALETIANELRLRRYGREEGLQIDEITEVDEENNEIPSDGPVAPWAADLPPYDDR